jgi:hypothetical protein
MSATKKAERTRLMRFGFAEEFVKRKPTLSARRLSQGAGGYLFKIRIAQPAFFVHTYEKKRGKNRKNHRPRRK